MLSAAERTSISNEIQTGPLAADLAALVTSADSQAIADALNASSGAGARIAQLETISRGLFLQGIVPASDRLIAGVGITGSALAQSTIAKWTSRVELLKSGDAVKTLTPLIMGLLASAIIDDLMSQAEIDSFTTHGISAAEYTIGRLVTELEIRAMLWNDDGSRGLQ